VTPLSGFSYVSTLPTRLLLSRRRPTREYSLVTFVRPWPWPRNLDTQLWPAIWKMYWCTKNEVCRSRQSKITTWTVQTRRHTRPNALPAAFAGGNDTQRRAVSLRHRWHDMTRHDLRIRFCVLIYSCYITLRCGDKFYYSIMYWEQQESSNALQQSLLRLLCAAVLTTRAIYYLKTVSGVLY